jgi:hypothetical protein
MNLQAPISLSLSHFVCHTFIVSFLALWIMESETIIIDNVAIFKKSKTCPDKTKD